MVYRTVEAVAPVVGRPLAAARSARERLSSRGGALFLLACTILVAASLVIILLRPAAVAPWRAYLALLALAAIVPQCLALADLDAIARRPALGRRYVLINAALYLLVGTLVPDPVLTFVLMMLVTQAGTAIALRSAIGYALALTLAWLGVLWFGGAPTTALPVIVMQNLLGIVFSLFSGFVIGRYVDQRIRAETLLDQLAAANTLLATAWEREKDLVVAQERVRIARDIHDGLGHHLTVLSVQLQGAARQLGSDAARASVSIAACREETRAALSEVRRSVDLLRGPLIEDQAVSEALAALVANFAERAEIEARFAQVGDASTLEPPVASTLYRVAQEGLTNARKHSTPTQIRVTLAFEPGLVRLRVWNDGLCQPAVMNATKRIAPGAGGGFGLAGMHERARQLGGLCRAEARAGAFTLEVALPIAPGEGGTDTAIGTGR